jgi:hypothetical protein
LWFSEKYKIRISTAEGGRWQIAALGGESLVIFIV